MLAIIGALALTALTGYILWGACALWWLVFLMDDFSSNWHYAFLWTLVAGLAVFGWWLMVGSHITIGLS